MRLDMGVYGICEMALSPMSEAQINELRLSHGYLCVRRPRSKDS